MKALENFGRLSFNQRITIALTALVGFGSLLTSIAAVVIASDSTDMKAAISRLGILATQAQKQTKRLGTQVNVMRSQLGEQRKQTDFLASQAQAANQQVRILATELGLSRKQLTILSQNQKLYEREFEMMRADTAQQYRRVAVTIVNLGFPQNPGEDLSAILRIDNKGSTTVNLEDMNTALVVTREPVSSFTEKKFAEFMTLPRKQALINIPPATGFNHTIRLPTKVTEMMIDAVNRLGFNVIVVAEIISKDPFGNLHHDYACSYSNLGSRDQLCVTPEAD